MGEYRLERERDYLNNNRVEGTLIDRTIYIFGEINTDVARDVISKIDLINEYDSLIEDDDTAVLNSLINKGIIDAKAVNGVVGREPIYLEINSNGGETSAGYSIITAIENSNTPIIGYVTGNCMSMAVAIVASCHYRMASEYSEFMIHDVYSGMQGKYSDLNSSLEYIERVRSNYNKVLTKYTKLEEDKVDELVSKNSDHYFSPFDARVMGIIDRVDTETIDEDDFFKKLYGDGGDESQDVSDDNKKIEELIEDIVEGGEDTKKPEKEKTNLEKLEELLGIKID